MHACMLPSPSAQHVESRLAFSLVGLASPGSTHACMHACMHARTHARTHACMHACMCTCMRTRTHTQGGGAGRALTWLRAHTHLAGRVLWSSLGRRLGHAKRQFGVTLGNPPFGQLGPERPDGFMLDFPGIYRDANWEGPADSNPEGVQELPCDCPGDCPSKWHKGPQIEGHMSTQANG